MSNTWKKRLWLWAIVFALCWVMVIALSFVPGADATTIPGRNKCMNVDKVWSIEEGSISIDTARVDVTGVLCTNSKGSFNRADSTINITIRPTTAGAALGWHYWERSPTYKIENTKSFQTFRVYIAYKDCWLGQFFFVCSPTGRFAINARWTDPIYNYPTLVNRWINHRNKAGRRAHWAS